MEQDCCITTSRLPGEMPAPSHLARGGICEYPWKNQPSCHAGVIYETQIHPRQSINMSVHITGGQSCSCTVTTHHRAGTPMK